MTSKETKKETKKRKICKMRLFRIVVSNCSKLFHKYGRGLDFECRIE